jgi:LmbE family N-acetylglucosaminyl deacetylase
MLIRRIKKYRAHFSYDLGSDFKIPLEQLDGTTYPIKLSKNVLYLPDEDFRNHTLLLEIDVKSTTLGSIIDPSITITSGKNTHIQYFERGCSGLRYLNLSAFSASQNAELKLTGTHLQWDAAQARLISMPNPKISSPALIIGPHPDDVDIASFGLYSNRQSWAVTVSAGEVGTHSFGGAFSDSEDGQRLRGHTRVLESLYSPQIGGVSPQHCINLGYPDGALEGLYRQNRENSHGTPDDHLFQEFRNLNLNPIPKQETSTPSWDLLVDDLKAIIEESQANTITLPHPLLDTHPDHQYVGLAALKAIAKVKRQPEILLYAVHTPGKGPSANIQPVGNQNGTASLPYLHHQTAMFDSVFSLPLDTATQNKKRLALDCYRDIRDNEDRINPPENILDALRRAAQDVYRHLVVYNSSFFRRFVRPNEIYYPIELDKLDFWIDYFESELGNRDS